MNSLFSSLFNSKIGPMNNNNQQHQPEKKPYQRRRLSRSPFRPASPAHPLAIADYNNYKDTQNKTNFSSWRSLSPNSVSNPLKIKTKPPLPPSPLTSPASELPFSSSLHNKKSIQKSRYRPKSEHDTIDEPLIDTLTVTLGKRCVVTTRDSAAKTKTEAPSPLFRLPNELLNRIVVKYPPNFLTLRATCRRLHDRLDDRSLLPLIPIERAGLAAAGSHAVSRGCQEIWVFDRLLDMGTDAVPLLEWACLLNRRTLVEHLLTTTTTTTTRPKRPRPQRPLPIVAPTQKALFWSASRGNAAIVRCLLERGAKPDDAALRAAARNHQLPVLSILLDEYAVPASSAALESALRARHVDLVEMFLDRGAVPNDDMLAQAAYDGSERAVSLLLDHGVVVSERAVDYADWGGHDAIVALLEDRAAMERCRNVPSDDDGVEEEEDAASTSEEEIGDTGGRNRRADVMSVLR